MNTPRTRALEASPAQPSHLRSEATRSLGHLTRPDGATDERHGRHVTPTDGSRTWQLKGRDRGGLHHVLTARRRRFFATRASWRYCTSLSSTTSRLSWSYGRHKRGRCRRRRGSRKVEEERVAGIATRHGSLCSTMPPEAASACFTLRPDGLPRRSHGQWSWDDSGAAKERSFRTAKCAQGTRPVRGFSASPGGAISLDCARC